MTNIAIIPARGGSRRIPNKNVKMFHGKPIMNYSIEAAQRSGLFDRVVVSTDYDSIAVLAEHAGAEVWMRDPAYGKNSVGTQEVVAECLKGIGADDYDTVCCIYATSPLMDIRDLSRAYLMFTGWDGGGIDYIMSVGYPPLQDAAQFYMGLAFSFMRGIPLVGERTRMIHIDTDRICDINTMEDWDKALKMYEALK